MKQLFLPVRTAIFAVAVGALFALGLTALVQTAPPRAVVARIVDSLAQDFVGARKAPSISIAVVRGADTIAINAWGTAGVESNVRATPAHLYRIGSVTKQFTAVLVMRMVEKNQVQLDDSIGKYLPTLPAAWHKVTVRQLLNHTSGIPSYTSLGAPWQARWGEELAPAAVLAMVANAPMDFAPGTAFRYNNSGYMILGMLIEKVMGRSWDSAIAAELAQPLGLTSTHVCPNNYAAGDAHGYAPAGATWTPSPYLSMTHPYAAGALCSTVGDLAKWNHALHTGKVVSRDSYALMTTPETVATNYGFGLFRDVALGRERISHGGGIHGFTTSNMWMPSLQLSITIVANSGAAQTEPLLLQMARAAIGVPLLVPPRARPITAAERAKFIGVYAMALPTGTRDMTFAERGEDLTGQLAGQAANPLLYLGDNTFGVTFDPELRLIFTVEGNRATKVTLVQGGGRVEGVRK